MQSDKTVIEKVHIFAFNIFSHFLNCLNIFSLFILELVCSQAVSLSLNSIILAF